MRVQMENQIRDFCDLVAAAIEIEIGFRGKGRVEKILPRATKPVMLETTKSRLTI